MEKLKTYFYSIPLEGYIWIISLIILAFINLNGESHFSICPLGSFGLDFCPGCGLGKSIHYFINFNFSDSQHSHPLGGIAFLILSHRIIFLLRRGFANQKQITEREKRND